MRNKFNYIIAWGVTIVALVVVIFTAYSVVKQPEAITVVCDHVCPVQETEPTTTVTEPVEEVTEEVEVDVTEPVKPETKPSATTEKVEKPKEENVADSGNRNLGKFKLTAYCPCSKCCGQWANGITATGTTAKASRTIAVDPKVIPYGTKVQINGKIYIAEDCGGSIKGNRIDVYFDNHSKALEFGIQYADVYIIGS